MGREPVRSSQSTGKKSYVLVRACLQLHRPTSTVLVVQYGIIAGGLSDGTICLWNPAPLVEGSGANPLLSKLQKHTGAVSGGCASRNATVAASNTQVPPPGVCPAPKADIPSPLQVKGLEFNSFSPNLLASGAADGELCIWDVATPAQPSLYPALKVRDEPLACSCVSCHASILLGL